MAEVTLGQEDAGPRDCQNLTVSTFVLMGDRGVESSRH